jgi:hypothetical protein
VLLLGRGDSAAKRKLIVMLLLVTVQRLKLLGGAYGAIVIGQALLDSWND